MIAERAADSLLAHVATIREQAVRGTMQPIFLWQIPFSLRSIGVLESSLMAFQAVQDHNISVEALREAATACTLFFDGSSPDAAAQVLTLLGDNSDLASGFAASCSAIPYIAGA